MGRAKSPQTDLSSPKQNKMLQFCTRQRGASVWPLRKSSSVRLNIRPGWPGELNRRATLAPRQNGFSMLDLLQRRGGTLTHLGVTVLQRAVQSGGRSSSLRAHLGEHTDGLQTEQSILVAQPCLQHG